MSAFAGQLSPTGDTSGITEIAADTFRLRRFRTPTGEAGPHSQSPATAAGGVCTCAASAKQMDRARCMWGGKGMQRVCLAAAVNLRRWWVALSSSFDSSLLPPTAGMQFIVTADVKHGPLDAFLRRAYQVYADYALKNPFYNVDMPIRYGVGGGVWWLCSASAVSSRVGPIPPLSEEAGRPAVWQPRALAAASLCNVALLPPSISRSCDLFDEHLAVAVELANRS